MIYCIILKTNIITQTGKVLIIFLTKLFVIIVNKNGLMTLSVCNIMKYVIFTKFEIGALVFLRHAMFWRYIVNYKFTFGINC